MASGVTPRWGMSGGFLIRGRGSMSDEFEVYVNERAGLERDEGVSEVVEVPAGSVLCRVSDPFGLTVTTPSGSMHSYDRGAVLSLPVTEAERLFKEGRVAIEEMRPSGAPPFVEAR